MVTKQEIEDLVAQCDANINSGNVNSFGSYDEGVRDTILWLFMDGPKPYIGREE